MPASDNNGRQTNMQNLAEFLLSAGSSTRKYGAHSTQLHQLTINNFAA